VQALITEQKKGAFALYALFSVGIMLVTRYIPIDNAAPPRPSEDAAVQEPLARTMALSYARSATLLKSPGLRAALMLTFLMLFIGDARGTFFILFLYEHGLSASAIGLLLSCGAVASMIVRPLGARLVERLPRALLVGTTVTMAVGAIAIIPTFQHPAAWALGVFIGSAAQGMNLPLSMLLIAEYSPATSAGWPWDYASLPIEWPRRSTLCSSEASPRSPVSPAPSTSLVPDLARLESYSQPGSSASIGSE